MLPPHLKYNFLEGDVKKSIILSSSLTAKEEGRLIEVLKLNQGAIGWQLSDLKHYKGGEVEKLISVIMSKD